MEALVSGFNLGKRGPEDRFRLSGDVNGTKMGTLLAYVWGGQAPRAVAARWDLAIFPGFFSIPCSVFRDGVVTIFRDLS